MIIRSKVLSLDFVKKIVKIINIPGLSDPEERETLISFDQIKKNGPGDRTKRISVIVWRPGSSQTEIEELYRISHQLL